MADQQAGLAELRKLARLIGHRAYVIAEDPKASDARWIVDRYKKLGEAVYAFERKSKVSA